jgi:hypothetical protein
MSYYFIKGVLRMLFQKRVWCSIELRVRQIGKNNELVVAYCKYSILLHMRSMKNVGVARRIPDSSL